MVAPPVLAVESARGSLRQFSSNTWAVIGEGLVPSTCTTGWFASTHTRSFAVSLTRVGAGDVGLEVLDVDGVDLATDAAADVTLVDDATDESDIDAIETQLQAAISAAAAFGSAQTRIDAQNEFLSKQMDSIKTGMGALVDADLEEASARLTALQTQQQLGIQALSIANQAPQSLLALFR